MIPPVEGLLQEPYNAQMLTLLYRLAEWHSLAKLRMHTDDTLALLDQSTTTLGKEMRSFQKTSATAWICKELPSETAARGRKANRKRAKAAAKAAADASNTLLALQPQGAIPHLDSTTNNVPPLVSTTDDVLPLDSTTDDDSPPLPKVPAKVKMFNLSTYKLHALGDYVSTIRLFGTTDSYSTQIVCNTIL